MLQRFAIRWARLFGVATLALGGSTAEPARAQEAASREPLPPVADVRPHELTAHGHTRIDPYYWLRDDTRRDPEILAHLEAENAYKDAVLAHTGDLRERLFQEIVGRIQQADTTAPLQDGRYWYYTRFEERKEYPVIARKREPDAEEEILLDGNQLARDRVEPKHAYVATAPLDRSPSQPSATVIERSGSPGDSGRRAARTSSVQ